MSESSEVGPEPARALTAAVHAAVAAAGAGDLHAFEAALAELGRGGARRPDPEQVGVVLGQLLGDLLERAHPDGIDSDDAERAVERCLRAARPWYPLVDEDQLIRALAGALRVDTQAASDAIGVVDRAAVTAHGLLLVADLLMMSSQPLGPVLDDALAEVRREQTIEHP